MTRRLLALAAIAVFAIGIGCSSGSDPIASDNDGLTSPREVFCTFDLTSPAVAEFTYTDFDGDVITSGMLGRDDNGELYIMENRDVQIDVNITALGLIDCNVSYKNPMGTAGNGLPYWYRGQTMEYDLNINSLAFGNIGWLANPATVQTEMRRAYINTSTGVVIVGDLMFGESTFTWEGIITPGYSTIEDDYYIHPSNPSGNFVTTCMISAPMLYGILNIIYFDGLAGMFDPY